MTLKPIAFCLLVALTGCKPKPPANGLLPITLQTDWYPQPEMGGFYEAQLQGLYKQAGLDVTIAPGGPTIVGEQMVATNTAQFSMGSSDKVLTSVSQGIPLVAVAATMQQDPQALMVHAASPVKTFADLEGKTIAAKPGSTWFQYLLSRFNLKNVREIPATYSVANFLQDPNYIQQAFVTSEPYFANKAGSQVRTLLISSTGYQPYRVIYTSRRFLMQHPDAVQKFVDASMAGWKAYLADPVPVDAELQKLNPALNIEQMKFSVETLKANHFVDGDGTPDSHLGHFTHQRWDALYQQLLDLKVITHPIDPSTAYVTRFAP
ncbi:NitT/TauT family transport system substrate-binding protein [Granulicella pectinivorans]|uniref:NitT/TauT family transport system substrate-binding protein n=1 Tax=Granulicella pectinivorans TaxID=474950 RepID=A0A1I6ME93_9BACT|nr:ABC transporter substrate-binding protein [Granulicella pectinivorans]SFS14056.1 NitT/TauT family transport system substrate-binding protein [Granulicella pectinivorans]